MTIDERLAALTMNLELTARDLESLREATVRNTENIAKLIGNSEKDAENIRALARVAEIHHERITRLEGGE
jgi:hypothetical protein